MSLIPPCLTAERVAAMGDADFMRLVVEPGEKLCAALLEGARRTKADNKAFLDERYGGITMDDARVRWTTPSERDAIQDEYREWLADRHPDDPEMQRLRLVNANRKRYRSQLSRWAHA